MSLGADRAQVAHPDHVVDLADGLERRSGRDLAGFVDLEVVVLVVKVSAGEDLDPALVLVHDHGLRDLVRELHGLALHLVHLVVGRVQAQLELVELVTLDRLAAEVRNHDQGGDRQTDQSSGECVAGPNDPTPGIIL